MYAKDSYKPKYQYLIKKREDVCLKHLNDLKAFIELSNEMKDVYDSTEEYNPGNKQKVLIVFDHMTADIISSKKLHPVVTELFIRGRKYSCDVYHTIIISGTKRC